MYIIRTCNRTCWNEDQKCSDREELGKRTLARSTGAVTSVVGTAERKPAAANSAVERLSEVRLGVKVLIKALDVSYA